MPIGLIDPLTPAQRRFVLLDNGVGAFVVNLLLNGAIAWLLFRKATHVPMWGHSSIAGDTIVTAFLLPAITCLIVTPVARGRMRTGRVAAIGAAPWRWIPCNVVWRALLIGLICLLVLSPLTLFVLGTLGVGEWSPRPLRLLQGNVRRGRRRIGHSVSCSVGALRLNQWLECHPFVRGFQYEAGAGGI